ncbi:MAG: F0F1 ATP synthase subunit A, partial [Betaproteobacteria bacterium]|nr:F0F1 ATP synthase subunit A [Betaproteobacteria bacterium]
MASGTELTSTSYIDHHLTYLTTKISEGSFWVLHVDTLITSLILGVISFGFIWLIVRKATPGVP